MVSNPMPFAERIENVRSALVKVAGSAAAEDFRVLMEGLVQGQMTTNPNALAVSATARARGLATQAAPMGISMEISGANGAHTVQIDNGEQNGRTVWHQIRYSPVKSFSKTITTMPPTTATHVTINQPGIKAFFQRRSSYDGKSWSDYELAGQTPVNSGKMTTAAASAALALNQTNFATVNASAGAGGGVSTLVTVSGVGGPYTGYIRQVGTQQIKRPSATIINPTRSATGYVAYDGKEYHASPTLAGVMNDNWEPVGAWNLNGTAGGGGLQGGNGGRLTAI